MTNPNQNGMGLVKHTGSQIQQAEIGGGSIVASAQNAPALWAAVKALYAPQANDAEFLVFREYCIAYDLNPVLGEAFFMKTNQGPVIGVEEKAWMKQAHKDPAFRRIVCNVVFEADTFGIDMIAGKVKHDACFDMKKRGRLLGAWAYLEREGHDPIITFADFEEYSTAQKTQDGRLKKNWATYPQTMIKTKARKLALQQAYTIGLPSIAPIRAEIIGEGESAEDFGERLPAIPPPEASKEVETNIVGEAILKTMESAIQKAAAAEVETPTPPPAKATRKKATPAPAEAGDSPEAMELQQYREQALETGKRLGLVIEKAGGKTDYSRLKDYCMKVIGKPASAANKEELNKLLETMMMDLGNQLAAKDEEITDAEFSEKPGMHCGRCGVQVEKDTSIKTTTGEILCFTCEAAETEF